MTIEIKSISDNVFKHHRFNLQNEKALQLEIEQRLITKGYKFTREHALSKSSIIDFMIIGDIGIEVKLKGTPKTIYEQCLRYCLYPEVKQLVLVTNKTIMLPVLINNKPTHTINLGQAWL